MADFDGVASDPLVLLQHELHHVEVKVDEEANDGIDLVVEVLGPNLLATINFFWITVNQTPLINKYSIVYRDRHSAQPRA